MKKFVSLTLSVLMVLSLMPSLCRTKFFTFSKKIILGFFSFAILATSKNNVPRLSSNPL